VYLQTPKRSRARTRGQEVPGIGSFTEAMTRKERLHV
jgi:hypothetical protein